MQMNSKKKGILHQCKVRMEMPIHHQRVGLPVRTELSISLTLTRAHGLPQSVVSRSMSVLGHLCPAAAPSVLTPFLRTLRQCKREQAEGGTWREVHPTLTPRRIQVEKGKKKRKREARPELRDSSNGRRLNTQYPLQQVKCAAPTAAHSHHKCNRTHSLITHYTCRCPEHLSAGWTLCAT